jgi:hypothetical protein
MAETKLEEIKASAAALRALADEWRAKSVTEGKCLAFKRGYFSDEWKFDLIDPGATPAEPGWVVRDYRYDYDDPRCQPEIVT